MKSTDQTLPRVISRELIYRLPLEDLAPWLRELRYLLRSPGEEHYRLLALLGTWFEGRRLYDIGTGGGHSAVALSWNKANRVISYDVANSRVTVNESSLASVEFRIGDCTKDAQLPTAALVFLDASPHDGLFERELYDRLVAGGFQGLLVLDDMNSPQFPGMRQFWLAIDKPKIELTPYGHHSGTGLVNFAELPIVLE
jgi:hypothetical protein